MRKNTILKIGNFLIAGIDKKINGVLGRKHLVPKITPENFLKKHKANKHRYCSTCFSKKGEKIVFYARLHNNEDAKNKVRREILFLKEAGKKNFKINDYIPRLIDYGIEKDFEWFTRDYIRGDALGDIYGFNKKPSVKLVTGFLEALKSISGTSAVFKNRKKLKLEKKGGYKSYLIKREEYKKLFKKGIISKNDYFAVKKFIEDNKKDLNKQDNCIAHGDFHPGNIILENSRFWIVDWELMQINNFTFDISFFWLHSKGSAFCRNLVVQFMDSVANKELAKKLFRLSLTFLLSGEIARLQLSHKTKNNESGQEYGFLIKTLKNVLIGFEEVVNMAGAEKHS